MATIEQLYGHLNTLTKQWFYDKAETDALLNEKLDAVDIPTNISDLNNDAGYLTQHQDISGKANSADLATVATTGLYTDLENVPATFEPTPHEHSSADVKDANAHSNLGTSANATQSAINTAIDTKIGSLLAVDLIEVVSDLPTASVDTKNALYLVAEDTVETNDAYEIFVTVEDNNSYDWEKVDSARLDLSGYATVNHTHGNLTTDGCVGSVADKVVVTTTNGLVTTSDWVTEVDNVIQALNTYGNSLNNNS